MPMLVCSAISCVYNKGEYCSREDIQVGGKTAVTAGDTCCESFKARTGMDATNTMGSASAKTQIGCEACKCQYNDNCCCTAAQVDIAGASACTCDQTECGTFLCGK